MATRRFVPRRANEIRMNAHRYRDFMRALLEAEIEAESLDDTLDARGVVVLNYVEPGR